MIFGFYTHVIFLKLSDFIKQESNLILGFIQTRRDLCHNTFLRFNTGIKGKKLGLMIHLKSDDRFYINFNIKRNNKFGEVKSSVNLENKNFYKVKYTI